MVCLGSNVWAGETSRLNKLIRKAASVMDWGHCGGCGGEKDAGKTADRTLRNTSEVLLHFQQTSSCRRNRYRKSFWPQNNTLFNKSHLSDRENPHLYFILLFKCLHYSIIQHLNCLFIHYLLLFSSNNGMCLYIFFQLQVVYIFYFSFFKMIFYSVGSIKYIHPNYAIHKSGFN